MFKEGDVVKLKKEENSFGSIYLKPDKSYTVEHISTFNGGNKSFNPTLISFYDIEYFFIEDDFVLDEVYYRNLKINKIKLCSKKVIGFYVLIIFIVI